VELVEPPRFPATMSELNTKLVLAQQKAAASMAGGGEDLVKEFFRKPEDDVLHCGSCIRVYDAQGTQVGVGDLGELKKELNTFAELVRNNLRGLGK
jgi:hypothetical protein